MNSRTSIHGLVFILILPFTVSCIHSVPKQQIVALCPENQKAMAIWQENMKIIEWLLSGQEMDFAWYFQAADFFTNLTGINPEEDLNIIGRMPSKHLHAAYEGWNKWYEGNKQRLWYDTAKGRVILLEPYQNTP